MNNKESERKYYLDIMRGIATVFVVLFHVTSNKFVSSWLGTFQLYIFFFVSGCLFRNQSADRYIRSKYSVFCLGDDNASLLLVN